MSNDMAERVESALGAISRLEGSLAKGSVLVETVKKGSENGEDSLYVVDSDCPRLHKGRLCDWGHLMTAVSEGYRLIVDPYQGRIAKIRPAESPGE